ncbi:MAG: hypothetical protein M5U28_25950 [Sandaracinaceae bacterium]|nr:hypothetical protein [Sandaracinaceae bacterium]
MRVRDDAARHGEAAATRMADGPHLLADREVLGEVVLDVEEVGCVDADLHDREIVVRALVHAHAVHVASVRQDDAERPDARRDVSVREDPAVGADDEAGAEALAVLHQRDVPRALPDHVLGFVAHRRASVGACASLPQPTRPARRIKGGLTTHPGARQLPAPLDGRVGMSLFDGFAGNQIQLNPSSRWRRASST